MTVFTFKPRFHEPVRKLRKRSTIRRTKRCDVGAEISLRAWSGRPYHSTQEHLISESVRCRRVRPIELGLSSQGNWFVIIHAGHKDGDHCQLNPQSREKLAAMEGFDSAEDMRDFFVVTYNLKPGSSINGWLHEW